MQSWRTNSLLLAGTAALLVAIPAASQESPESLLPPGFGDPQNLPTPENKAQTAPAPDRPPAADSELPALQETGDLTDEELAALEPPRPTNYFAIPEGRARPVDVVGILEPGNFGFARQAFGRSDGRLLATLMRRLDAPLPSRWGSILLRRALLSRLDAPRGIDPVDWVAERADLLLRMGEADAARLLVQSVDNEYYTSRMIEVAGRTALATADPAALCPLVGPARARSRDPVWILSEAMCAALEGEAPRAASLLDEARRNGAGGIDLMLTEKVVGSGLEARRAATVVWDGVSTIDAWRFGLASATGAEIPAPLLARLPRHIQAWRARAPMLPLEQRLDSAGVAASLGVFSSRALVEAHSLMLDQTDAAEQGEMVGVRLRTAWADRSVSERLEAMRSLWTESDIADQHYARLVLTAGAAARIPASADHAGDAANLIASMLSAGLDRQAARWAQVAQDSGDDRAWAMLAVGAPRAVVDLGAARVQAFIEADDSAGRRRAQLLVAALIGLGRVSEGDAASLAGAAGLDLARADRWGEAIDQAARNREPATVALLAAVGMQAGAWGGVPPHYLFRTVRALRSVGLEYEARMIAAEAIARL